MKSPSIKTLLEYTPYDNKCPSPFGIRDNEKKEEDKFYSNKLFVEYPPTCEEIRNKISKYIEEPTIHFITFSGSSGSGKTTFLKDYFRNKKNEYHCRYINLVEYPSSLGDNETVATTLKGGLKLLFSKDVAWALYDTYRNKGQMVDLSLFLPKERDRFMSFCESFSRVNSPNRFEDEMEKFDFYNNNDLTQLLSLYLISSIVLNKNDDSSFVFVFDNLDEVGKQYLSSILSIIIKNAFSIAQVYCEQVIGYLFSWNVTFLLSVRMENQRYLRISDNQERTDILHSNPNSLEFSQEYQAPYSNILNARLLYYDKNCRNDNGKSKDNSIKQNYDNINNLLHSEEVFFKRFIKPLYSYDYRMFTHFAISDLLQEETILVPEQLISPDGGNAYHQGARGMLLFYSLRGLLENNLSRFSSYVKEEFSGNTCNIFRMSFTLLSNLSGWSRREQGLIELLEDEDDFNERTRQIEMPKFLNTIESWYKEEKDIFIPKVLEGLIGTSANSFECPILLFGDTIDKHVTSLAGKFSVAELATKIVQDYRIDPNSLASITIQINPLCIVYSARVFIHYEYFNLISPFMRSTEDRKTGYKPQPLFQFIDFDKDFQNIANCLSNTFETAQTIINKADIHFCKICNARNNGSCANDCKSFIKNFKEDGFSFNNTIHATRIVSAHIHYLDSYRQYLWYRIGNKDNHSDKEIQIQRMIIEQILKYINFYDGRKVKDALYDTITKYWKKQYENALTSLNNHSQDYTNIKLEIMKSK